ncbi:hypothetical protein [Amycolatopsis samaneae]|uniref:Uncharacterized protein n=1 Tax=Amycolatopsis samaneae TaxID=664691 RepID=A0ABW5GAY6_9PSEU
MTKEKELFVRALGTDEPPLNLDFEALEATNTRRRRAKSIAPLAGAAVAVSAVIGGVALVTAPEAPPAVQAAAGAPPAVKVEVPTVRDIAYCYRTADIGSREPSQRVPIGINGTGKDGRGDVAAVAMRICGSAWRDNVYHWQPPGDSPGQHQYAVPALVSCVLDSSALGAESGAVGVFPGDAATCAALGLSAARIP